jgi:DNA replication protein DnaC
MEERHHRKPTLITTNLLYPNWQDFLANPALTKALLSRLRERCHTININGPCIRPQTG